MCVNLRVVVKAAHILLYTGTRTGSKKKYVWYISSDVLLMLDAGSGGCGASLLVMAFLLYLKG